MSVVTVTLLSLAALTACSSGAPPSMFYVVIKPDEADKFIAAVSAITKEEDMETATAQVVSDARNVLKVLEGRGPGLKLWAQNEPLSGHEDPKLCGVYLEPHPDPAQFVVFIEPRLFGSKAAAIELGGRGFDVRLQPAVCGVGAT